MAYFKFEYLVNYPEKLIKCSGLEYTPELYKELKKIAVENIDYIAESIRTDLAHIFPELKERVHNYPYRGAIDEIVKNCLDSVNSLKVEKLDLKNIQINFVIITKDDKITIKIKDNGIGFAKIKTSKKLDLSNYLDCKKSIFFPLTNFLNHPAYDETMTKSYQKKLGKDYILGGFRVGLKSLNNAVKKDNGKVIIKNRKALGASIEITIPFHDKRESLSSPKQKCGGCNTVYKMKDCFWNTRTHEADAVYCNNCDDVQFINPFSQ